MDARRRFFEFLLAAMPALMLGAAPAAGQSFEVPQGFAREVVREQGVGGESRAILRVTPEDGAFSDLSKIELEPLAEDIDDPKQWLTKRMSAPVEGLAPDPETMLDGPDSPFGDPAFDELREAMAELIARLAELGELPLEFCDGPQEGTNPAGPYHELSCRFAFGPINQYLVLRLQNVDGLWYYTRIRTMNERRLRHLTAIANSFHLE